MEDCHGLVRLVDDDGRRSRPRDLYRFYHAGDDETLALAGRVAPRRRGRDRRDHRARRARASRRCSPASPASTSPTAEWCAIAGNALSRRRSGSGRASAPARSGCCSRASTCSSHLTVGANVLLAQRLAGGADPDRAATAARQRRSDRRARTAYPHALRRRAGSGRARRALANDPRRPAGRRADRRARLGHGGPGRRTPARARRRTESPSSLPLTTPTSPRPPTASSSWPTDESSPEMTPLVACFDRKPDLRRDGGTGPAAGRRARSATATHRDHGAFGLGQEHPPAPHGRARPSDERRRDLARVHATGRLRPARSR